MQTDGSGCHLRTDKTCPNDVLQYEIWNISQSVKTLLASFHRLLGHTYSSVSHTRTQVARDFRARTLRVRHKPEMPFSCGADPSRDTVDIVAGFGETNCMIWTQVDMAASSGTHTHTPTQSKNNQTMSLTLFVRGYEVRYWSHHNEHTSCKLWPRKTQTEIKETFNRWWRVMRVHIHSTRSCNTFLDATNLPNNCRRFSETCAPPFHAALATRIC